MCLAMSFSWGERCRDLRNSERTIDMKRFLVGCALALAVLAASEQRASAGSCGFNIGVDVGFRFSSWRQCNNNGCAPAYPYGGYAGYPPPGYPHYGYAQAPMAAPAAP